MSDDGYIWGDARVTYPDWQGTAQLDQRMTTAGIEELVGLDADEWTVVGIDIGGSESGVFDLEVVAVHRSTHNAATDRRSDESSFEAAARGNGGELHATHFRVDGVDAFKTLKRIMHLFEFRLRRRGATDVPIRIMSRANLPEMFMQPER